MSQPEHKTKKRKHATTVAEEGGAGESSVTEPSTKRSKKDKDAKKQKREKDTTKAATQNKGKGRATDDAFRIVRASLALSVPPYFATDLRGGVEEMLDSMLMRYVHWACFEEMVNDRSSAVSVPCGTCRYIPALQGVVLAHDRLEFLDKVATIKADCPFANCRVAFDATVWSPQVGMKLGKLRCLLSAYRRSALGI